MASTTTSTTFEINLKSQLMEKIANINTIVKNLKNATSEDIDKLPQLLIDINKYLEYQNRNLSLFSKVINLFFGNPGAQGAISLYKQDLEKIVEDLKELTQAKTMLQTIMTNIENIGIADEDKTVVLETLNEQKDKCFVNLELMLLSAQNMSENSKIAPYQVREEMDTAGISDYIYGIDEGENLSVLSGFRNYLYSISEEIQKEEQNKAFLISIEKILDSVLIPMNIKIKVIKPILDAVTNPNISENDMKSRIAEKLSKYRMNLSIAGTPGDFGIDEFEFPPLQEELKNILKDNSGNSYFLNRNIIDDNLFQGIYRTEKDNFRLEEKQEDLMIDNELGVDSNARMNDLALILASFGHYKGDTKGIDTVKKFVETIKTPGPDANKIMRHLLYSIGSANKSIYYAPYILALIKASIGYNDEGNDYTNVIEILKARKERLRIGLKGPVQMKETKVIPVVDAAPDRIVPSIEEVEKGAEELSAESSSGAAAQGEAAQGAAESSSAPATAKAAQMIKARMEDSGLAGPKNIPPPQLSAVGPPSDNKRKAGKNMMEKSGFKKQKQEQEGTKGGSRKRKSRKKSKKNKKKKGGKRKTKRKR